MWVSEGWGCRAGRAVFPAPAVLCGGSAAPGTRGRGSHGRDGARAERGSSGRFLQLLLERGVRHYPPDGALLGGDARLGQALLLLAGGGNGEPGRPRVWNSVLSTPLGIREGCRACCGAERLATRGVLPRGHRGNVAVPGDTARGGGDATCVRVAALFVCAAAWS